MAKGKVGQIYSCSPVCRSVLAHLCWCDVQHWLLNGAVGVDALSIDSNIGADFTTIEYLLDLGGGGDYDYLASNPQILEYLLAGQAQEGFR